MRLCSGLCTSGIPIWQVFKLRWRRRDSCAAHELFFFCDGRGRDAAAHQQYVATRGNLHFVREKACVILALQEYLLSHFRAQSAKRSPFGLNPGRKSQMPECLSCNYLTAFPPILSATRQKGRRFSPPYSLRFLLCAV
ncbi:hypothetical protein OH76DRAFT_150892 [Lentinus brumalis]|uniref:Uncharacterized protein n=1 Tax=Lentinus brumalis TaxID=2498619 RepID=A0A371CNZ8_9APHY|nr:hypothetical protein OH76DRAFT_150892 [Polyporus brumalis]